MAISSATQLVDRLFDLQFVYRDSDEIDRRITRLIVAKKGREELEAMKKKKTQQMKKIFSILSPADIKDLLRIQKTLLASLKKQQNI